MPPYDADGAADTPTTTVRPPRLLDPDARFARLPRPSYDPDDAGIRPGAPVALSLVGGVLVAVSPFGAWLRVTRVATEEAPPTLIHESLGFDVGLGVWVALLGFASVVASVAWYRGGRLLRRAAHVVVLTAAAVTGIALMLLQGRIDDATAQAIARAGFYDLTAGVGWGAWAAVAGASALVLASVCAALAAPVTDTHDLRRR